EVERRRYGGPVSNLAEGTTDPKLTGHRTLGHKIINDAANNHWHRLLAFLRMPSTWHEDLEGNVLRNRLATSRRTPGGVNLNTLRHPHVMAGVLDDNHHL